jgi:hypothetical protein
MPELPAISGRMYGVTVAFGLPAPIRLEISAAFA